MTKRFTLFFTLWISCLNSLKATYIPVALSGFNEDLIANGAGPASGSVSRDFDGGTYAFVGQDFAGGSSAPTRYLPATGVVNSTQTTGLTYQLAPYTGSNVLHLITSGSSGTLTFNTPLSGVSEVFILGTSGGGVSNFNVTVNYAGGGTMTFPGQSFADWYTGTAEVAGIGRVSTVTNTLEGTAANPRLYRIKLTVVANYSSQITGISFNKTSATGYLGILAVSVNDAICTGQPNTAAITAPTSVCPGENFDVTSTGSSTGLGISYQWQSAPASTGQWTDIPNATNTTYTATGGITTATDYQLNATCVNGGAIGTSNTVSVSTLCYCKPTYSNGCSSPGNRITNVTRGSFVHNPPATAACTLYNYTNRVMYAAPGATVPMSVTTAGYVAVGVAADFSADGDFDDADETLILASYIANSPAVYSFNISIPATIPPGNYRLRVWCRDANAGVGNPVNSPCGAYGYGNFVDYTLNVDPLLSLKITEVSAVNKGSQNDVYWATSEEKINAFFDVERSEDGRQFNSLGTVPAKGNAASYSFTDTNPVKGVNYYRLRMTDAAGKINYSKMVTATLKDKGSFTTEAYPNPVTGKLSIRTYGTAGNDATLTVSDVTGKTVVNMAMIGTAMQINMEHLPQGLYFVRYADDRHAQVLKITKQ